jgi:hypothetical protein
LKVDGERVAREQKKKKNVVFIFADVVLWIIIIKKEGEKNILNIALILI